MPPYTKPPPAVSVEYEEKQTPLEDRKMVIAKKNVTYQGYVHLAALYGLYVACTSAKWGTVILGCATFMLSGVGVTAGAHRLWAHRTYRATLPLQIILMMMNTFAFQNTIVTWVRAHRLHHKYSDTDADPHNATRGFFYSHIGWLLVKPSETVKQKAKAIDMSDILANPVLMFQDRYALPFVVTVCFIVPTITPMYLFGESLSNAWHVNIFRYVFSLHVTFLVNSAAHLWGNKPYDKHIRPAQSLPVSLLALGEGYHNYHHVFPWDYRAAELGNNWINITTHFIDLFARVGWAYDLKSVSDELVWSRAGRTGDGTNLWGWGDTDMNDEMKGGVVVKKAD